MECKTVTTPSTRMPWANLGRLTVRAWILVDLTRRGQVALEGGLGAVDLRWRSRTTGRSASPRAMLQKGERFRSQIGAVSIPNRCIFAAATGPTP